MRTKDQIAEGRTGLAGLAMLSPDSILQPDAVCGHVLMGDTHAAPGNLLWRIRQIEKPINASAITITPHSGNVGPATGVPAGNIPC